MRFLQTQEINDETTRGVKMLHKKVKKSLRKNAETRRSRRQEAEKKAVTKATNIFAC